MGIKEKLYNKILYKPERIVNKKGKGPIISLSGFSDIYPIASPSIAFTPSRNHFRGLLNFFIQEVDAVIYLSHHNFNPKEDLYFDFNIGFGSPYRERSSRSNKNILLLTEDIPSSLQKYEEALYSTIENNHTFLKRANLFYIDDDLDRSDLILMIGDKKRQQLLKNKNVKVIPCSGLINHSIRKEHLKNNNGNLLWFGSGGVILKGLPLAIEVAQELEKKITVVGANEIELRSLKIPKNVILHKRVRVNSNLFSKIILSHDFLIFPSWSEGMSTSVSTCMMHGLIPVVHENCGYNDYSYVNKVKNNTINEYCDMLLKLQSINIIDKKKNILTHSRQDFNYNNVNKLWIEAIKNEIC